MLCYAMMNRIDDDMLALLFFVLCARNIFVELHVSQSLFPLSPLSTLTAVATVSRDSNDDSLCTLVRTFTVPATFNVCEFLIQYYYEP